VAIFFCVLAEFSYCIVNESQYFVSNAPWLRSWGAVNRWLCCKKPYDKRDFGWKVKEGESQNDEKRASEKGGEDANQGLPGEFL